jgi:hypothetical protein
MQPSLFAALEAKILLACQAVVFERREKAHMLGPPSFYSGVAAFAFRCARKQRLGLAGLEPATLRLSSACSNQLSYRPE